MRHLFFRFTQTCLVLLLSGLFCAGKESLPVPDYAEVLGLVRSNMVGATEEVLNEAALNGLLAELGSRVALVTDEAAEAADSNILLIVGTKVYRDHIGYIRVGRVDDGLASSLQEAFDTLQGTNKLAGLVLDLRFAWGGDYAAAVAAADLFHDQEVPLLNWGRGLRQSSSKSEAIKLPLAILTNRKTRGSAEALAGILRHSGVGLILGDRTAGVAGIWKTFPLSTGGQLRISTELIQLGDAKALAADGVRPDISVEVSLAEERMHLETNEARWEAGDDMDIATDTNESASPWEARRIDEADLMRRWRGEANGTTADTNESAEITGPDVTDPALARALDLIDGLAIIRQWRK